MKKISNRRSWDCLVIGAALFAMFFGAGNMIFPPYLGLQAGKDWFLAFLGYYIADIGLAVLAMLALIRTGGSEGLLRPLGKVWGTGLMLAIILCLGPLISIPRTAATTFELSIQPLVPGMNMLLFCAIFFLAVCLLSINESAVVDIVGKILTPLLFCSLLLLIGKGVLTPLGPAAGKALNSRVIASGISAGYQTMDVLASTVFGALILNSAAQKGHTDRKSQTRVAMGASLVAGAGLLVVYLGLTYLGATARALPNTRLTRIELLIALIRALLPGQFGLVFFAVIAGLACLTTAIALTSASARYFSGLSGGKLSYRTAVIGICVFSALVSGVGVEQLVTLASPILSIVYPPVLALVLLSFVGREHAVWMYRLPAAAAMAVGLLEVLVSFGAPEALLNWLPLSRLGFAWVVPVAVAAGIGALLQKGK